MGFSNTHLPSGSSDSQPFTSINDERCVFEKLNTLKLNNPKNVMLGHLNINSIPTNF